MVTKTSFEPKAARILFEIEYDDRIRQRKTATQSLVDFLNTTSPEEFQKKRTSTPLFFRRKKTQTNLPSTTSAPTPHNKKNYIEIITQPFHNSKPKYAYPASTDTESALSEDTRVYSKHIKHRQPPSLLMEALHVPKTPVHDILPIPYYPDHDLIELGLKKRLEQHAQKPSDWLSQELSKAHCQALEIESGGVPAQTKKRSRHVQVQTMTYVEEPVQAVQVESASFRRPENVQVKDRLRQLEHELLKERQMKSRLEAALEERCDQYEVLAGLAYKKLKEVWEEKVRWETACIEAKEKCWHDHQHHILGDMDVSNPSIDFSLDEQNDVEDDNVDEEDFI